MCLWVILLRSEAIRNTYMHDDKVSVKDYMGRYKCCIRSNNITDNDKTIVIDIYSELNLI